MIIWSGAPSVYVRLLTRFVWPTREEPVELTVVSKRSWQSASCQWTDGRTANPNNETVVRRAKSGCKNSAVTSLDDGPGQRQRSDGGHKTGVMAWTKNTRNLKRNDVGNWDVTRTRTHAQLTKFLAIVHTHIHGHTHAHTYASDCVGRRWLAGDCVL